MTDIMVSPHYNQMKELWDASQVFSEVKPTFHATKTNKVRKRKKNKTQRDSRKKNRKKG